MRSSRSHAAGASGVNNSRRSDIHSEVFSATPARRRRMFVDENGMPVGERGPGSDAATFSNLDPNTSEADAMGGLSTRTIWGTNISLQDTMSTFKEFLRNYQAKYRMWADGASEEDTSDPESGASVKEYVDMMRNMLHLGVTGLNLDARNLKAYPPTIKLWHQLQAYPHEIIPMMDQTIKDVMVDLAEEEMTKMRHEQRQAQLHRGRQPGSSSIPPAPSSDGGPADRGARADNVPYLVQEVETSVYKVKPFGLDQSINMRDLNPNGTYPNPYEKQALISIDLDKMISVKGLVIRTTPIIPDMKMGTHPQTPGIQRSLTVSQLSSNVRLATTPSMCPWIAARSPSRPNARDERARPPTRCRSCTTAASSRTSR